MINHNEIQEFFITKLKANTALVNLMGANDEIRERQWAGLSYDYPAVRVSCGPQSKTGDNNCMLDITMKITVFTRDSNDYILNDMVYAVTQQFEDKSFGKYKTGSSITISESMREGDIWHSEVTVSVKAINQ